MRPRGERRCGGAAAPVLVENWRRFVVYVRCRQRLTACLTPAPSALRPLRSSRPLTGFTNAAPTWGALEDCWQQLAVVKSGRDLTFYRNKEAAGEARQAVGGGGPGWG